MAEPGRAPPAAPGTEGLPRAFLQSLRPLFDILDDRRRGYVHLREIESRWRGAGARELPRGVLEGLRRVAPASGYLTFERFVAGLRASLGSADGGPRGPARGGGPGGPQPPLAQPPHPPQRLAFAAAEEPRTILERKPLPLGARPPAAGPGGAARSLEKLCVPAEAAPGLAEPERPQGTALERSPSSDAGECVQAARGPDWSPGSAARHPQAGAGQAALPGAAEKGASLSVRPGTREPGRPSPQHSEATRSPLGTKHEPGRGTASARASAPQVPALHPAPGFLAGDSGGGLSPQ